jgi:hypothetical protein
LHASDNDHNYGPHDHYHDDQRDDDYGRPDDDHYDVAHVGLQRGC